MPILDKKILLKDIEHILNDYVPANTVKKIMLEAGNVLENYEISTV